MSASKVTDDTFADEVLNSSEPVVVDFWAEWCGPCKQIAPALDEIATEMQGTVKVAKINVEENDKVPMEFGIQALPTLMIFKNGEVASIQRGACPKSDIVKWINETIA